MARFFTTSDLFHTSLNNPIKRIDISKILASKQYLESNNSGKKSQIETTNYKNYLADCIGDGWIVMNRTKNDFKRRSYIKEKMTQALYSSFIGHEDLTYCICQIVDSRKKSKNKPIYKIVESLPNKCTEKSHIKYIPISLVAKYLNKNVPNLTRGTNTHTKIFEGFSNLGIGLHLILIRKPDKNGNTADNLCVGYQRSLDNIFDSSRDKTFSISSIRKEEERYHKMIESINIDPSTFMSLENTISKEQILSMNAGIMNIVTGKYTLKNEVGLEKKVLGIVENSIIQIIQDKKKFSVELFGSRKLGLSTIKSDLDIIVNFSQDTEVSLKQFIDKLTRIFKKEGHIAQKIFASVPLIKLVIYTERRKVLVDISFQNTSGIVKNFMVNAYIHSDPRVIPLLIAVREWATNRDIVEGSFLINSYGYMMLMLTFLCENGVLLPFKDMIDVLIPLYLNEILGKASVSIHEILESEMKNMGLNERSSAEAKHLAKVELFKKEVGFGLWIPFKKNENLVLKNLNTGWKTTNNKSISELLIEFFRYYGFEHDYENDIVSLREGEWLNNARLLTIEDPLEIERDCGRNLSVNKLEGIRSEMRRSYFILKYGRALVSNMDNLIPIVMTEYKYSNPLPLEYWISEFDMSLPVYIKSNISNGKNEE
ncbi:hypothetical protein BB558_004687 [Smittium angustum]|uniref:polynucleotide adenylyltransferase n=1 Tax=Smittium angustum TaxID=133377 RepID=A0A2U1J2R7_SMIAN|nr:hypothetical protein BB558_004687 [Smittium angustum]